MNLINSMESMRQKYPPSREYSRSTLFKDKTCLPNKAKLVSRKLKVPLGPVFYPSVEDFSGNPLHYIEKIRPIAEKYGICKIVPPEGWDPRFNIKMDSAEKFQTKKQQLHRLQEGISFEDGDEYSASTYLKMAQEKILKWRDFHFAHLGDRKKTEDEFGFNTLTPEYLEQKYWDVVDTRKEEYSVEYGNDVDTQTFGSGFPRSERGRCFGGEINAVKEEISEPAFGTEDFYKETYWNLNNIPFCPDSILRLIKVGINGINVPWMYFGSLFTTFCWHNEDNYLYSINYHHWGAPKQWYGVPGSQKDAEGLERVFQSVHFMKMREAPDLLHHITTMLSPILLQEKGVPVYKLLQYPGEFVVTFPRAYHGGFSMGPNVGEAVNFATYGWIDAGAHASERYRAFARPEVFSHDRLTYTMANHLEEQKTYRTSKLLLHELKRLIKEEVFLRKKTINSGVRNFSNKIKLPKNRFDQLDEESADYDDKRLCHACKHVCFFSCIACECSQSRVSCLRHSHYMCRCPKESRYMMIWSTEEEMRQTYLALENLTESLRMINDIGDEYSQEVTSQPMPADAPGSLEDRKNHQCKKIDLSPLSPILSLPVTGLPLLSHVTSRKMVTNDLRNY